MKDKTNDKEEFIETSEYEESDLFKKVSLGITPSMISGISASYTKSAIDVAGLRSAVLKATNLGITPSQMAGLSGLPSPVAKSAIDVAGLRSAVLKATSLGIMPSQMAGLSGLPSSVAKSAIDVAGLRSAILKATNLGITPSQMVGLSGLSASVARLAIDVAGLRTAMLKAANLGLKASLFDDMINTYQSSILDSEIPKEEFTLSESLKVVDEFVNEIQDEVDTLGQTDFVTYSEEEIQFIAQSLENWLRGSINLKDTIQKIKGSFWAAALVTTIVFTAFTHIVNILLILDDHQIQQERKTMESIETYLETSVLTYKLYKNLRNVEKLNTFHPIGFTRTNTYLRDGKSKTAPVVTDGFVEQKTLALMLDRKNNWRKVEVKINETYLQGWVPESAIIRLKKYD